MNYRQTIQYLYDKLPVFHRIGAAAYKPDIGNITDLCEMLGQPHRHFRSIHIAGTNGKGSVAHMLASILQCAGYKTGLHTSPHLKDYRERFRINGKMILKKEVIDFVAAWKERFMDLNPSFFEISVALAFERFAAHKVDIAVVETGMGGRLDSTNILHPEMGVITNIGWDHMVFLGDTLEKIAREKAGIIKPGVPTVIGEALPETRPVFVKQAKDKNAPLRFAEDVYSIKKTGQKSSFGIYCNVMREGRLLYQKLYCPVGGDYQLSNSLTVIAAVDVLREKAYAITDSDVRKGLSSVVRLTGLKGRWQVLKKNPLTIADTGHNKNGITFVLEQLKRTPHAHLHIVLGMVNDKDIDGLLGLLPRDASYYFCKPDIPRGLDAEELSAKALKKGLNGEIFKSVPEAYHKALKNAGHDDLVFVGGSTFVVAEVV